MEVSVFWFRRDLRLDDNTGLALALKEGKPVLPVFIFDKDILEDLDNDDHRVSFIYNRLLDLNQKLSSYGSSIFIAHGKPLEVFSNLLNQYKIVSLYYNKDYEPYAMDRDRSIDVLMKSNKVKVFKCKDHVIFEENEVVKDDESPYIVYTPYKRKWLEGLKEHSPVVSNLLYNNLITKHFEAPAIKDLGFNFSGLQPPETCLDSVTDYEKYRDNPGANATTRLSTKLRFGTVSIRKLVLEQGQINSTFLSELIWREFFMQILFHFPKVVNNNFRRKYDKISWRNDTKEFELWKEGKTGYPIVDAGMRELNATGFMHNRVRMIVASFLTKHLLINWQWGEAHFAKKLFDYELSSNNGNWQWAAGTGCDAAPYFRVFNPWEQQKKFDPQFTYIKKWIPDYDPDNYIEPIVDHKLARERAIEAYKEGLKTDDR